MTEVRYRNGRRTTLQAPLRRAASYVGGTLVETKPCGIAEAARLLNCSPRTLHRWVAAGAPVVHEGRRGRGSGYLIDPAAVAAWRRGEGSDLSRLAAHLPRRIADVVYAAFVKSSAPPPDHNHDGIANRPVCLPAHFRARFAADLWISVALEVLAALREADPTVGSIKGTPEAIRMLRQIGSS